MKMRAAPVSLLASYLLLAACVTVNVYFPASAAEDAADRFIRDVYGAPAKNPESQGEPLPGDPTSGHADQAAPTVSDAGPVLQIMNMLIPAAQAQTPDITISTPAINSLRESMRQRHQQFKPFYENGAIGLDSNGYTQIRDESQVPLKDRNSLKRMLADENRDRDALYREVARANNHPEWEANIRKIFAKRWIGNMPAGWWFMNEQGQWQQK